MRATIKRLEYREHAQRTRTANASPSDAREILRENLERIAERLRSSEAVQQTSSFGPSEHLLLLPTAEFVLPPDR
jgi:hypothetical protein